MQNKLIYHNGMADKMIVKVDGVEQIREIERSISYEDLNFLRLNNLSNNRHFIDTVSIKPRLNDNEKLLNYITHCEIVTLYK